jgi:hypothetical protein
MHTIELPFDGHVHVIYGFPTVGKTTAQRRILTAIRGRIDYMSKTPLQARLTDTENWFGGANVNHQNDIAARRTFTELMTTSVRYTAGLVVPRNTLAVLFTSCKITVRRDYMLAGFFPSSSDSMIANLREREPRWKELQPRFLQWYDDLMASAFFKALDVQGKAIPLGTGDYLGDHLSVLGRPLPLLQVR